MALVPLFDEVNQFNDYNGTVLAAGKLYVYHLGRTRLADIYSDLNGTVMQNPVTLDNLGRGPIYVSQDFNYTLVVMDEYGQEMFSQDKCIYSQGGPHNSANVAVGASEYIAVSSTQIGDTTVYTPYLTGDIPGPGSGGKTYHGIDPIVVNNIEDKISANTVPFGVQEPLYFVEDETATIIGLSGNPSADAVNWVTAQGYLQRPDLIGYATTDFVESAVSGKLDKSAFATVSGSFLTGLPEGTMNESGFEYDGTAITGYDGSAFKAGDEFPQSATEAVELVTSNSASWNDVSGKLDTTATGNFYLTSNPSGFITDSDIANKLDTTAFSTVSGSFLTSIPSDVVKTGDLTASSNWDSTYNTVYTYSSTWTGGGGTARPVLPVTGVSGIQVQESGDQIVFSYTGNTVPAGVLVESGLEYDSDNKITGYSGSAFAGGGGGGTKTFYATIGTTTFSEITAAYATGDNIIVSDSNGTNYAYLTKTASNSFSFTTPAYKNSTRGYMGVNEYKVNTANTWTTSYDTVIYPMPSSTADSGKVLAAWYTNNYNFGVKWIDPPSGELPQSATEVIETVTANSGNWNSTYTTVSDNSASWGGVAGGDMFVSGLAYTTGGEISSYSGSAFRSTDPTYELSAGYGISLTTGANSLTIANTLVLETGSI